MNKLALLLAMVFFPSTWLAAEEVAITVHNLQGGSIGDSVGVIVARETPAGLVFEPHLNRLDQGAYEVTVHEHATCHGRYHDDGSIEPGASAGNPIASLPVPVRSASYLPGPSATGMWRRAEREVFTASPGGTGYLVKLTMFGARNFYKHCWL